MNDCYFNMGRKCVCLTKKSCKRCRFRKTKKQLEEGRRKALDRLMSLPPAQRDYLIMKYGLEQKDYEI